MSDPMRHRIAVISLHTSPLDQPGTGDSGGMNVEIRALSERLADRGLGVDVFTRCAGRGVPQVDRVSPGVRVIQVSAGPCAPVEKDHLPGLVPTFVDSVVARAEEEGSYDLVHAHYWLSGRAAAEAKRRWRVPLVSSFHTLGEVKNLASGLAASEPAVRLRGERAAIAAADRILAPTVGEADQLVRLYGAERERIRVVAPGVDPEMFRPRNRDAAKAALGLRGRVAMFLGRLQPVKGPDLAIRAVAEARRMAPSITHDLLLALVGGPSGLGGPGYVDQLRSLAEEQGIGGRIRFLDPRPHRELAPVYGAADVLIVPSRSESFGLAALEAQACGVPVIAAAVGGLRSVVAHGSSGFLVPDQDPAAYAALLVGLLRDEALADRLARGAREHALRFSWERSVGGTMEAYGELVPEMRAPLPAA